MIKMCWLRGIKHRPQLMCQGAAARRRTLQDSARRRWRPSSNRGLRKPAQRSHAICQLLRASCGTALRRSGCGT